MAKRAILAVYCAVMILLPACTLPLVYADMPAPSPSPRSIPLRAVYSPPPPPEPSSIPSPASVSPAPVSSSYSDDSELASEAVYDEDVVIEDFSVSPGGELAAPPALGLNEYPHYIGRNHKRYQAFIAAFPHLPVTMALALVNVSADFGHYEGITQIANPHCFLVLSNKNFRLPVDYVPQNLRFVGGTERQMVCEAATAFELMHQALQDELGLQLVVVSAYRSYNRQNELYTAYAARDPRGVDTYSARPGHSEHQTGLAIDFLHRRPSGSLRRSGFQNTAQFAWLQVHAHKFGFILRYPSGYEPITGYIFESWHWRYIGTEDATRMFEAGMATFEEYTGTFLVNAPRPLYNTTLVFVQR